ncbi:MAG TPA: acyl-CoA dehydrogenase family protein, partial [Actinomycetota bacterium]|nr:acyl-CoA dehydrogenase family protein [Actinomycetota bacterium]
MTEFRFGSSDSTVRNALFLPEHDELRKEVRAFVERELQPEARAWESAEQFPKDLFARVGELGFFGLKYPDQVGGSGPDLLADAVVTEEFARCGSAGVAASLGAHKDLAALYLFNFGTEEQHDRWLRPAIRGHVVGCLAVTEPDAGSDVAALRTSARRDGDGWVINGSKSYITNGAWADFVVVAAKSDAAAGHAGITLFVADADAPGFSARRVRTLGWRPSQTGEILFDDVRVPDSHRLGDEGAGFYAIMQNF